MSTIITPGQCITDQVLFAVQIKEHQLELIEE